MNSVWFLVTGILASSKQSFLFSLYCVVWSRTCGAEVGAKTCILVLPSTHCVIFGRSLTNLCLNLSFYKMGIIYLHYSYVLKLDFMYGKYYTHGFKSHLPT